jgi:hypothetical protein
MTWALGGSSGESVELLGSSASGCSETDATTAVLADGIDPAQTSRLGAGYLTVSGHGLYRDPDTGALLESGAATALHVIPATQLASWRLDTFGGWRLPIAPYVRAALERYHWIVTGTNHGSTTGATNGWSVTAGLALSLDGLDPDGVFSTGQASPSAIPRSPST